MSAGRKLYDWVNAQDPNAEFWDDLTAVERRWWNRQAETEGGRYRPFTPMQRLAIWAAGVTVCGGALAALVGVVWYGVSRW